MNLSVPVIGILRGVEEDFFPELMETAFDAGLQAIEVTMNTDKAENIVSGSRPSVPQGKFLGMGTIRNMEEARRAVDAGASFLVTPNTDTAVIGFARSCNIPIVAGAFTPTEVYAAWSAGADMVKVFPCGMFGPAYVRELLGPFDDVRLVAVGGVTAENVGEYLDAGACAVGASSSLFGREALRNRDLDELSLNVRRFVEACRRT